MSTEAARGPRCPVPASHASQRPFGLCHLQLPGRGATQVRSQVRRTRPPRSSSASIPYTHPSAIHALSPMARGSFQSGLAGWTTAWKGRMHLGLSLRLAPREPWVILLPSTPRRIEHAKNLDSSTFAMVLGARFPTSMLGVGCITHPSDGVGIWGYAEAARPLHSIGSQRPSAIRLGSFRAASPSFLQSACGGL